MEDEDLDWTVPLIFCAGAWHIEPKAEECGLEDPQLAESVHEAGRRYFLRMAEGWFLGDLDFEAWAKNRKGYLGELEQELRERLDAATAGKILKWLQDLEKGRQESFSRWMREGVLRPFIYRKDPDGGASVTGK